MLTLPTARALKEAGLDWNAAKFDFFAVPERGLDEQVFVITDMPAALATLHGQTVVTFEGAMEWALDFVAAVEVIWLPTEAQLRAELAARLLTEPEANLTLRASADSCRCTFQFQGQALSFEAADGGEAYAAGLLAVLRSSS